MVSYAQALEIAQTWVRVVVGDEARVDTSWVVKRPYGWIFTYQLIDTSHGLPSAGNSPLLVDRVNGELRLLGTARPLADSLAAYEATVPPAWLQLAPSQEP